MPLSIEGLGKSSSLVWVDGSPAAVDILFYAVVPPRKAPL
jgi:hypothetical protein